MGASLLAVAKSIYYGFGGRCHKITDVCTDL